MILHMISYMMVLLAFLARMISYQKLWYYIWYHSLLLCYHVWYHKINYKKPFLRYFHRVLHTISYTFPMILSMMSLLREIIPEIAYDICHWYHYYVLSWPYDITYFVISQPISWYLRGGLALVGGARRQVLHRLQPRHRQYAGDVCSTEQWLPWCRAWTCCIGCCARNALLPICSH